MSEGQIAGNRLELRVRLPRYEVEHIPAPTIAAAFEFVGARLVRNDCSPVAEDIVCQMTFEYAGIPGDAIDATVTLARITVPNHVHILKLTRLGVTRQGVFDRTFEREKIDFHQEAPMETWWRGARMGFAQMGFQPALLVLLVLIGWVAKPSAYLAASVAAFFVVLPDKFYAPPGFFELATALAISYLALEQLLFAEGGGKWFVSAAIGAIEGAALAVLARPAGAGAVSLGVGNLLSQALLALLAWRLIRPARPRWTLWIVAGAGAAWGVWVFVKRF